MNNDKYVKFEVAIEKKWNPDDDKLDDFASANIIVWAKDISEAIEKAKNFLNVDDKKTEVASAWHYGGYVGYRRR